MSHSPRFQRLSLTLVLLAASPVQSTAQTAPTPPAFASAGQSGCKAHGYNCDSGFSVFIDEDGFQEPTFPGSDRNYTMGLGLGFSGPWIVEKNVDFTLKWADKTLLFPFRGLRDRLASDESPKIFSTMLSGTAFTPDSLWRADVQRGDRPYSFLLAWTVRRAAAINEYRDVAVSTDLSLGTVGSRIGRNTQRFIHKVMRSAPDCAPKTERQLCDPKGWPNQLYDSPTGVPVFRYGFLGERRWLPADFVGGKTRVAHDERAVKHFEVVAGAGADLGYYTDVYASMRTRIGWFTAPFYAWHQNPLSIGYVITDLPRPPKVEAYLYGGIRPRLWAYNLLLQGYPGYSGYALSRSEIKTFEYDGEFGGSVVARFTPQNLTVHVTRELIAGKSSELNTQYSRAHTWGGWMVSLNWNCGH